MIAYNGNMRNVLQLTALAIGTLAAPGSRNGGKDVQRRGATGSCSGSGMVNAASETRANSTTASSLASTRTVYETVYPTTTFCSSTVNSINETTTKFLGAAAYRGQEPRVKGLSFGTSVSALATTSTTSLQPTSPICIHPTHYNNASTVLSGSYIPLALPSGVSATSLRSYNSTMSPVLSSSVGATAPASAATMTGGLISHTVIPATAAYPSSTTTTAASMIPSCSSQPTTPLTNEEQVGDSLLGTLCAPDLPKWLGEYDSAPWGDLTTSNSDATVDGDVPITNVTRSYEFNISRGRISADGVLRDVILINNQFPGPTIEANWGDWIEVKVNNNIESPEEGTSMHWHGQLQKGTPWQDGVPSVGQCPITPGHSFTYKFQAELHGTSWYHAHYSSQFTAGVAGPMVVHGPTSMDYDIDVGPVMLSDWYHVPYFSIVENAVGTDLSVIPPTSDAVLINGRGRFDCADKSYDNATQWLGSNLESDLTWTCVDEAPLASFRFSSDKVHLLRLINHGANGVQKFSIDHHNLTVIAIDYVPVVPYETDVVTLGVGQRAEVLVKAFDDPAASFWMRTSAPGGDPCGGSNNPDVKAAIYYEEADTTLEPTSDSWASFNGSSCQNDDLDRAIPAFAITPSGNAYTQDVSLTLEMNSTGNFEFRMNGQGYHANYNVPLLQNVQDGNMTFEPQWNVYNFDQTDTSIILNVTNNMPLSHPFHLHGHNFYVLNVAEGSGPMQADRPGPNGRGPGFADGATWDGTIINPENPTRRDTVIIPPYGFAALQFEMDNPGVWPFHCHVAWHLSGGQSMSILYKPDQIPEIPEGFIDETCVDWDYYSSNNIVDQIDAGA